MGAPTIERARIGELEVAFERKGAGPPLVLLHGGVADSREWRRQTDALSDEFAVVAWDAPGCGRSSDPPEGFLLSGYADCLAGLVEALELGRPHVAGLSFGATLALELYRRRPELPRTLILASAYAGWAGSLPPDEVERRLEAVTRDSYLPAPELTSRFLETLFTGEASDEPVEELAAIIADFHPHGARTMARAMAEADLRDVLPRVAVPTLLVHGDADVRAPRPVVEHLHASIPGSELVVVPGAGHQVNWEAADRFTGLVRDFLRRHDGTGAA